MKKLASWAVLAFFAAVPAVGQQVVSVDINKSSLSWTWVKGTQAGVNDGVPTEFRLYCGPASGQAGVTAVAVPYVAAANNSYSVPIKTILDNTGEFYCAATAANQFGESEKSNEVHFFVGVVPAALNNLQVVGQ
jgi:hypothetical protein